jgi:hypothetical protein
LHYHLNKILLKLIFPASSAVQQLHPQKVAPCLTNPKPNP